MACGIYGIKNTISEKIYVGQSINIKARYNDHTCDLRKNKHSNKHLQNSYNKYGPDAFELITLEECQESDLNINENKWINHYLPDVYNIILNTSQNRIYLKGEKNPLFGKPLTEETKRKISEGKKGKYCGKNNSNYGKKNTLETRIKMSEGYGKLTKEQVLEIVELLKQNLLHQEIADKYNIARTAITRISNGTRWTNVTGGPVIPLIYVDGVRQFSDLHRQRIGDKRKGQRHTEETKEKMRISKKTGEKNGLIVRCGDI